MRSRLRLFAASLALCLVSASFGAGTRASLALLTDSASDGANTFSTAASFGGGSIAPTIDGSVVARGPARASSYPSTVLADSPIAYWRLGEAARNATATDSSGNGRNGTHGYWPPEQVPGALGDGDKAARWDQTDAYVTVGHAAALQLNGAFSIDFWGRADGIGSGSKIPLRKGGTIDANDYRIEYTSSGMMRFGRNNVFVDTPGGVVGGTYRHYAVTYDGSTVRWYVDGALVSSSAQSYPTSTGTYDLLLGSYFQSGDLFVMDDVAFYSAALSATRVKAHYDAGRTLTVACAGPYQVYANATDSGGVASVTTDVSAVTTGSTAVALPAGSYSVGGTSYGYRSASLTANAAPGSYSYSVTATDVDGNTATQGGYNAQVTPPAGIGALWLTGMEHGLSTTTGGGVWTTSVGTGTATATNTVARSGAYSLKVAPVAAALSRGRTVGSASRVVVRFAVRLESLPAVDVPELAGFTTAANTAGPHLSLKYIALTKKFAIGFPGQTVAGNVVVQAGTWYVIDMRFDASGSGRVGGVEGGAQHTAEWRIDGVDQPADSYSAGGTTVHDFHLGSNAVASFTAHYDDIAVSNTSADYPIGNGKVLALRPNGMGTHNNVANFENNDGTAIDANTWMRLDDDPMTGLTDHVRQTTTVAWGYIELTFDDTSETCIRAVNGFLAFDPKGTNSANNGTTSIFDGSEETVVYSGSMTANITGVSAKSAMVSLPGVAFTRSAVNGLKARIGYSTDVNPIPEWHSLLIEYEVALP